MRVRFRGRHGRTGDTSLVSLVEGDVLPTVSHRDARREKVDVWTSENRVFACADPDILLAAVRAKLADEDAIRKAAEALGREPSVSEQRSILAGCDRLMELLHRERDEPSEVRDDEARSEGDTP
jgi:hypothetical protein